MPLLSFLPSISFVLSFQRINTWTCLAAGSPFTVIEFCSRRFSLFYLYCLLLFLQKKQTQKKTKHFARPQPPGCLWPKIKFPLGNIFPSIWDTVSGSALESLEANGSCFPACNPLRVGTKRYQLSLFLVKETLLILDTFWCMFKLTINYSLIIDKVQLLFQEENVELQSELLLWELFTLYVFIAIWTSIVA